MQEPYLFYEHEYSPILLAFLSTLPLQPCISVFKNTAQKAQHFPQSLCCFTPLS